MVVRLVMVLVVGVPVLGGCASDGVPSRAADVAGVVGPPTGQEPASLSEATDPSYDGMGLSFDGAVVVDGEGRRTDPPGEGTSVELWFSACAESLPPQCEVEAVRVLGP